MLKQLRLAGVLAGTCLAIAILAACGSSASSPPAQTPLAGAQTLAQVDSHAVTQQLLDEWMKVDIGSDYYSVAKQAAPAQLVSEPPNFGACAAAVNTLASRRGKSHSAPAETSMGTCEQLYRAIRAETLTFLVGSYWLMSVDAAHGIDVTAADVQRRIEEVKHNEYPRPGQFSSSLRARDRTLSQELFLARVDLLEQRLQQALRSKDVALPASVTKDVVCRTGYVVAHCMQFAGQAYSGPSASALLQKIAQ